MLFLFVLWNRHWSWCYFVLRIWQTGNRNKAILTIVIGLKNKLHWNLVKSALDKEDKSVSVYSLLFNFLFVVSVCNVFNYVLCLWIIRNVCNLFNRELMQKLFELLRNIRSDQVRSVAQSCPTLFDPMNRSTPGLPVHHQLPEFTQTHVHQVSDTIQPSHPLSSPSPPAPNPSQHQSLFQWVNTLHKVAKVLEFQL